MTLLSPSVLGCFDERSDVFPTAHGEVRSPHTLWHSRENVGQVGQVFFFSTRLRPNTSGSPAYELLAPSPPSSHKACCGNPDFSATAVHTAHLCASLSERELLNRAVLLKSMKVCGRGRSRQLRSEEKIWVSDPGRIVFNFWSMSASRFIWSF